MVVVSDVYESKPYGYTQQPDFLNMAVGILTTLDAFALLKVIKGIESESGRVPTFRWGSRTLDIDILLYGNMILDTDQLKIPHPDFRNRDFVLTPLKDIARMIVDPVSGKTIEQLYSLLEKDSCVRLGKLF